MNWIEFDEEQFKKDTDTLCLTDAEIVEEAIASLQQSYYAKDDGYRRIEKVSLLAIYILTKTKEEKENATTKNK